MVKKSQFDLSLSSVGALLISVIIWGWGFVFVKWMLPFMSAIEVHLLRFFLAGSIGFIGIIYYRKYINKKQLISGLFAALLLYAMLLFQTVGLDYTTVAKSGFLTATYLLFVPLILFFFEGKRFSTYFYLALVLALLGIYFLTGGNLLQFNLGDLLTIICGFFAALHMIYLEKISKDLQNGFAFNCLQCFYMGIFSVVMFPFFQKTNLGSLLKGMDFLAYGGLIGLGLFSSILAFSFQVVAQKKIPSHIVGVLFLLESPFAALFGYLFLEEKLTMISMFGCLLILMACFMAIHSLKKK
jgi:drug/metabolite transporter (DMT)-like permease